MTTPIFITGFEHGVTPIANGGGLAAAISGSPEVQGTVVNTGIYALKLAVAGANEYVRYSLATPTMLVGRVYFRIDILPAAGDIGMLSLRVTDNVNAYFHYAVSDTTWRFGWNGNNTDVAVSGVTITTGTWYCLDFRADISGGTRTIDWQIDGVAQTQATRTQIASTFTFMQLGTSDTPTMELYYDDLVLSVTSGDYPIGPGGTVKLYPNADGTHNIGTANYIEDALGNDIDGVNYFAYGNLNQNPMGDATWYIRQAQANTGYYAEVQFNDIGVTFSAIIGAQAILAYRAATATACDGGCIISKDAFSTQTTIWGAPGALADYSESSVFWKSVIVAGANSESTVNALVARLGYSSDATPDPYWIDLGVEVAYTITAGTDLVIQNGSHGNSASNVALTQEHNITVANGNNVQAADNVVLTQVHGLTIANDNNAHSAGNVVLTQAHNITMAGVGHTQTAENAALIQVQNLVMASGVQTNIAENVALAQSHKITIANGSQAQASDNITLGTGVPSFDLVIQGGNHSNLTNAATLSQVHNLQPADGNNVHGAGIISLTQTHSLTLQSGNNSQISGNLSLDQAHNISVAECAQEQSASNVNLGVGVLTIDLTIQPATNTQYGGNLALSQQHNLLIGNSENIHVASAITLNISAVTRLELSVIQMMSFSGSLEVPKYFSDVVNCSLAHSDNVFMNRRHSEIPRCNRAINATVEVEK